MNKGILRTNVKLTSNYKILVGDSNLYLSSIDSSTYLSDYKYKDVIYKDNNSFISNIKEFWYNTTKDVIYNVLKNTSDYTSDYTLQYDNLYWSGVTRYNKTYEYEYFAPLFLKEVLSNDYFIIFKMDGIGLISDISNIINNMTVVKSINLKIKLDNIINELLSYGDTFININTDIGETSKWCGIDIYEGVYTAKSLYINDIINKSQRVSDGDFLLTNGFEENNLITNKILNLSFLFNDTITEDFKLSQYYGYYGKLNKSKTFTFKTPTLLKTYFTSDVKININADNYFICTQTNSYINPFQLEPTENLCIEYNSYIYDVINANGGYKIVTHELLLNKINDINRNIVVIENNTIKYNSIYYNTFNDGNYDDIYDTNNNINSIPYTNDDLYNIGVNINLNDIKLIEIDGALYRLKVINDKITIDTGNSSIITSIKSMYIDIYDFILNDMLDFDTDVVNTKYSNFEYEYSNILTNTHQPKLYKHVNDEVDSFLFENQYVNIPTTSEYISTSELFEIDNNRNINKIWDKNPSFLKFGYVNSIDANNYPYRFNSFYTYTNVDIDNILPERILRNLDYFYNISTYTDLNVIYQSLVINSGINFNISQYLTSNSYFEEFFTTDRLAVINGVDKYNSTNSFLFKGLKVSIYQNNNGELYNTDLYKDYKTTILLSSLTHDVEFGNITSEIPSDMIWKYAQRWEVGSLYKINDLVYHKIYLYGGVDYVIDYFRIISNDIIATTPPNVGLGMNGYEIFGDSLYTNNVLYISYKTYDVGEIVFYDNEWWYANSAINNSSYDNISGDIIVNNFPNVNNNSWSKIFLYDKNNINQYYILENDVYKDGEVIKRIQSNNTTLYNSGDVIFHNNSVMYLLSGSGYLNDGIIIFVDKDNKNILFNIYSNDNTIDVNSYYRDDLYKLYLSKYTANSFINHIQNGIDIYSNPLKIIIKENDNINNYNNINSPIKFTFDRHNYIEKSYSSNFYNKIFSDVALDNTEINKYDYISTDTINYYDGKEIAYIINNNIRYYNSSISIYKGQYSPIMKNINMYNTVNDMVILINKKADVLKNTTLSNIYPLIDSFGLDEIRYNIYQNQFNLEFYKNYIKK